MGGFELSARANLKKGYNSGNRLSDLHRGVGQFRVRILIRHLASGWRVCDTNVMIPAFILMYEPSGAVKVEVGTDVTTATSGVASRTAISSGVSFTPFRMSKALSGLAETSARPCLTIRWERVWPTSVVNARVFRLVRVLTSRSLHRLPAHPALVLGGDLGRNLVVRGRRPQHDT